MGSSIPPGTYELKGVDPNKANYGMALTGGVLGLVIGQTLLVSPLDVKKEMTDFLVGEFQAKIIARLKDDCLANRSSYNAFADSYTCSLDGRTYTLKIKNSNLADSVITENK